LRLANLLTFALHLRRTTAMENRSIEQKQTAHMIAYWLVELQQCGEAFTNFIK
jgi:hypothetical protein